MPPTSSSPRWWVGGGRVLLLYTALRSDGLGVLLCLRGVRRSTTAGLSTDRCLRFLPCRRAASCSALAPPPWTSTASTLRRTPRWSGALRALCPAVPCCALLCRAVLGAAGLRAASVVSRWQKATGLEHWRPAVVSSGAQGPPRLTRPAALSASPARSRFQPVHVPEPTVDETYEILTGEQRGGGRSGPGAGLGAGWRG